MVDGLASPLLLLRGAASPLLWLVPLFSTSPFGWCCFSRRSSGWCCFRPSPIGVMMSSPSLPWRGVAFASFGVVLLSLRPFFHGDVFFHTFPRGGFKQIDTSLKIYFEIVYSHC